MRQQLKLKQFVPDLELLEIAEKIRKLKSRQIANDFTHHDGSRCVMGALAVEFYDANDNYTSIMKTVNGMSVFHRTFEYNKYDELSLWWHLAERNNNGVSFHEIADWVEDLAHKHGEWK